MSQPSAVPMNSEAVDSTIHLWEFIADQKFHMHGDGEFAVLGTRKMWADLLAEIRDRNTTIRVLEADLNLFKEALRFVVAAAQIRPELCRHPVVNRIKATE